MKKRLNATKYLKVILIAILFAGYGCADSFFDEQAGDRITPDEHYKTLRDASSSWNGAIIPLQDFMPKLIMVDGLRSDMMDVTDFADGYLKEINEQVLSLSNPYTDFSGLYKVIINCNEVLANIDRVGLTDRLFDDYVLNFVKGGMITLRSWAYLTIIRLYGEAAYIPDNMTSLPEKQTFMNRLDLIDTLINQNLPFVIDNTAGADYVEYRIQYYPNNKAIIGELYLEKNDYTNAIKYLKLACESYNNASNILKVDRTFTEQAWKNIFVAAENNFSENIMVIPYSSTQGQVNPVTRLTLYSDEYQVKPTQMLIDSFSVQLPLAGADTGDFYRGLGTTFDVSGSGEAFINKYAIDKGEPYSSDIIVTRAADLHLLLAEALNRSGDPDNQTYALLLMNSGFNSVGSAQRGTYTRWNDNRGVRGRAYLKPRAVPLGYTGDVTEYIEDMILAERSLELAFEGKRWFDLVRVANRRGTPEYLADKVAAKFGGPGNAKYDAVHAFLMNPDNWYLPKK